MSKSALIGWKEECETIHKEMDRLLTAAWLGTAEERQVRKIQFMACIERRNVAAQNLLRSNGETVGPSTRQPKALDTPGVNADPMFEFRTMNVESSQGPSEPAPPIDGTAQPPPADSTFEVAIMNSEVFHGPSEPTFAIDRPTAQLPPADPIYEVENVNVQVSEESSKSAIIKDRDPQPPPAEPMFEVKNFLKLLRLK